MAASAELARPSHEKLAGLAPYLRTAVAPHAEELVRVMTGSRRTKTVLTRRNHRRAIGAID